MLIRVSFDFKRSQPFQFCLSSRTLHTDEISTIMDYMENLIECKNHSLSSSFFHRTVPV